MLLLSFSAGLLTQSISMGGGQKQKTSAAYDSYGQKTSSTDVNNTTTSYDRSYYIGHHVGGITEGSLKQQRFTYLTNERLSITSMDGLAAQHYNYSTGQLSALARKSRVGTGAFTWQSYHFAYDPFGNMTQISVSGADNTSSSAPSSAIMLAKYQYESGVNNTTTSYDRSYYIGHHVGGITEGSLKQFISSLSISMYSSMAETVHEFVLPPDETLSVTVPLP